ncbi:CRISPR-associated endonuclease Cas1 [Myxococcota bacterium]|nr:CRISPR-associated endonuclease Cas1 [Myxococcota bacterium]
MRWLVLQGHERSLGARDGQLVLTLRGEEVLRVHPTEVDEVQILGDAVVTPAARRLLLQAGIPTLFLTAAGAFRGVLLGPPSAAGERRLAQLRAVLDGPRRLHLARAIVSGKLQNQLVPLRRAHRARPSEVLVDAQVAIQAAARSALEAPDLDSLRGVEGYAARVYFGALPQMLRNPLFSFAGRSRRPPKDPVNAALSFLYTLLCTRTLHAAFRAGLDPYVGLLHDVGRGKPALALDLAEEWRPLVDAVVLRIFNQAQVTPDDFVVLSATDPVAEPPEEELAADDDRPDPPPREGGVWLGSVARTIALHAWDERLRERSTSPHLEGRWALRDILDQQARHLSACFLDPSLTYQPFAWR